jgi:predicted Zn finger-like uncharacterized protein
VIIQCPNCSAKYQYDEDRFERKPSKKIKCAKCQKIFEIQNPAFAPKNASGDATGTRHEDTQMRRDRPTAPQESTEESPIPSKSTGKAAVDLSLPAGKRLSLAVIDGADAGNVFRIEKPRVTIGRSGADLVINDSEASRQHAAIEVRDLSYLLRDLGSTNGTMVDGQKIDEVVELTDKGEFQIGSTTLMLIVTDDV